MNPWRRFLAVTAISGAAAASWIVGSNLVQNVQYARAAEEVEATRKQLAQVEDMATVFRQVGKVVEPAVVSIEVRKTVRNPSRQRLQEDLFRRFFPDRDGDGEPDVPEGITPPDEGIQQGQGSGVIMEFDAGKGTGYIVTNNHVAGGASEMIITLNDGREITDAKLVGTDPKTDLAVIELKADRLIAAKWGNSDYMVKGDFVLAFGSPFGYVGSMTHGIVSALNRQAGILGQQGYESFIQVDAPINPGNSGGPLVNLRGEVVGINTAIASRTGGFQGIGFAIPSNQAKNVYDQIRDKGRVVRGWLGVRIGDVADGAAREIAKAAGFTGDKGVLVTEVTRGTPAEGKLEPGDVIIAINQKQTPTMQELRNTIAATPPGTEVKLKVVRQGKEQEISVTIGEQPDDLVAAVSGRDDGSRPGDAVSAASLGLRLTTPTENQAKAAGLDTTRGALVTSVEPGSPAARNGLQVGDLITRVGTTDVSTADEAASAIAKQDLSKGIALHVTNRSGSRFVFIKSAR